MYSPTAGDIDLELVDPVGEGVGLIPWEFGVPGAGPPELSLLLPPLKSCKQKSYQVFAWRISPVALNGFANQNKSPNIVEKKGLKTFWGGNCDLRTENHTTILWWYNFMSFLMFKKKC